MLQALLGEQVAWALEDRMEISHQVNILRESQGGHYTPFISAELNKALKMKLDSSTSLQSIIRTFMGGGTTNIFNQFGDTQNNQLNQNQGISIDEARKIILESQKIMDKPQEAKLLADHYDLSSLPEVVATKQEGIDTTKEGLTLNTAEMRQITDDYKGAMELSSREHHELRREIEANIDPEDPDPEMDIYLDEEQYEEKEPPVCSSASVPAVWIRWSTNILPTNACAVMTPIPRMHVRICVRSTLPLYIPRY